MEQYGQGFIGRNPEARLGNRPREMNGYLAVGTGKEYPVPALSLATGHAINEVGLPIAALVVERARPGRPEKSSLMSLDREQGTWSEVGYLEWRLCSGNLSSAELAARSPYGMLPRST